MSHGYDFSDRLSPFLVKELRQGLRGKVYLALFLLLTLALAVYSIAFIGDDPANASRGERGLFNAIIFIAIAVLLPLNALGAIGEERRGRKIELVMLSRVKARGVIAGKWLTAAMQSCMLTALIAPFVVLRYFAGGVDMTTDIVLLAFSLFCGLTFTAVTLCASAFLTETHPVIGGLLRGIILLVSLWVGLWGAFALGEPFGISRDHLPMMLTALATLVISVPVFLEITASRLAPEAENHDGVIRLLGIVAALATVGVTVAFNATPDALRGGTMFGGFIILACLLFTVFGVPLEQITYRTPTDRFGSLGRLVGKAYLSPGMIAGFTFALTVLPVAALCLWFAGNGSSKQESMTLALCQFWAAALWPLIPIHCLRLHGARRFVVWLLLQLAGGIVAILAHTQHIMDKSLFDILPTTALFNLKHNTASTGAMLGMGITFLLVAFTVFFSLVRRARTPRAEFAQA